MAVFVKTYLLTLLPSFLLCLVISFLAPIGRSGLILSTILLNALVAMAVVLITDRIGAAAAVLFKGGTAISSTERYAANLDRARFFKRSGQHEKALAAVDEYLEKAAPAPEALFLKARILWDGYRDAAAARHCLQRILNTSADPDDWCRWSKELLAEIEKGPSGNASGRP